MTDPSNSSKRPAGPARVQLDTSHITRIEVPFRFLTYVFGGGVEHLNEQTEGQPEPSRPHDPVTPVRATGIRGQLRFWWRATTGARCANIKEMRDREATIWGGIWDNEPTVGVVGITVDTGTQRPTAVPMFGWGRGNFPQTTREGDDISYGAFPMRPKGNNGREADPRSSVWDHGENTYTLALDILDPSYEDEILLALNAWLCVGGYGGRTTRGFGAVALASVEDHDTRLSDAPEALQAALRALGPARLQGVPALVADPSAWAFRNGSNPRGAWGQCLSKLQEFRQGLNLGRNAPAAGSRSPGGRSRWPEPDAIRRASRRAARDHSDPLSNVDAFPRGDFGMPIIFHFKDGDDPKDHSLQPRGRGRFPSPLILRPTAQGKGMAVRLAKSVAPEDLELVGHRTHPVRKSPTRRDLSTLGPHQTRLLIPQGAQDADPIAAFMQFFGQ